jgi:septal ring factor EnvC (AmiA/AmiB activator)
VVSIIIKADHMTTANPTQAQRLFDKMDEINQAIGRLDKRLDVHDEKHISLDKEHSVFSETLRRTDERLQAVERRSERTERDVEKLTKNIDKLVWAITGPTLAIIIGAIAWAVTQVTQ